LKICGFARAAQALAPRVALSFLFKSIDLLKYSLFNRQSSINGICDLLKPSFLYNMLLEKMD